MRVLYRCIFSLVIIFVLLFGFYLPVLGFWTCTNKDGEVKVFYEITDDISIKSDRSNNWIDKNCNIHTFEELDEILKKHMNWLEDHNKRENRADLSNASLILSNLSGENLKKVDLGGADLRAADLRGADLESANLKGADLRAADLTETNLTEANLREASLELANLKGANLVGVTLELANLKGANLSEADLRGANLISVDLSEANLSQANLNRSNLRGANLMKANLIGVDLRGANLTQTNMSRAYLPSADLSGANLNQANLSKANLSSADLIGAKLSKANLSKAFLAWADLSNTDLRKVNLSEADFTQTKLKSALFLYCTFEKTFFEPDLESLNSDIKCIGLRRLWKIRYRENDYGLFFIRDKLNRNGTIQEKKEINYAILHSRISSPQKSKSFEDQLKIVFFEWTCDWGLSPVRPLIIIFSLIFLFSLFYWAFLDDYKGVHGLWKYWQEEGMLYDKTKETQKERLSSKNLPIDSCLYFAFYFSVLSAFNIGWRDLSIGSWTCRMQFREYTLRATGWPRFISGLQSVISVYLFALAILSYFGNPFDGMI